MAYDSKKHTVKDIYKQYDNKYNLTEKEFRTICKTFNLALMKTLVNTGHEYKLPYRLGSMSIRKKNDS